MLAIKTESPIFDNIESISGELDHNLAQDQINFTRKKAGLGLIEDIKSSKI